MLTQALLWALVWTLQTHLSKYVLSSESMKVIGVS